MTRPIRDLTGEAAHHPGCDPSYPNPAKSSSGEHWPNIDRNCDTKVHTFGSGPEGHREVVLTHISHPFCPEFASQSISNRFGQVFSAWGQDGQAALGRRYHEGRSRRYHEGRRNLKTRSGLSRRYLVGELSCLPGPTGSTAR
jgi:hypothetical protein